MMEFCPIVFVIPSKRRKRTKLLVSVENTTVLETPVVMTAEKAPTVQVQVPVISVVMKGKVQNIVAKPIPEIEDETIVEGARPTNSEVLLAFKNHHSQRMNNWLLVRKSLMQQDIAKQTRLGSIEDIACVQKRQCQARINEAKKRFDVSRKTHAQKIKWLDRFCRRAEENGIAVEDRADILQRATRMLEAQPSPPVQIPLHRFDQCLQCGDDFVIVEEERALLCMSCGVRVETLDTSGQSTSTSYSNMDRNVLLLSCQRMQKVKEVLKQLSARQKSVVPFNIVLDITKHMMVKLKLKDRSQVRFLHIRETLREMDLANFNDYCAQIYAKIIGCSSVRISPRQEQVIMAMFAAIEDPWNRLKATPNSSFLNVTLVVLTFCKFLGYYELLPYLCLSKTRVSIEAQEDLLRQIFADRGWTPFPCLTHEERVSAGLHRIEENKRNKKRNTATNRKLKENKKQS